jgi:hypothetical protein
MSDKERRVVFRVIRQSISLLTRLKIKRMSKYFLLVESSFTNLKESLALISINIVGFVNRFSIQLTLPNY